MALWEWGAAGAVFVAVVVFSVRLMKRGLSSLDDDRAQCLERIYRMEKKILEDQKNMSSREHLRIAHSGLKDMLRLAGNPPKVGLEVVSPGLGEAGGEALLLHLPEGTLRVSLSMREQTLRGVRKVSHGRGVWHLRGRAVHKDYTDLAFLMRAISEHLAICMAGAAGADARFYPLGDPAVAVPPELPHLARRFVTAQTAPRRRKSVGKNAVPDVSQERSQLFRGERKIVANPGPVGSRHC